MGIPRIVPGSYSPGSLSRFSRLRRGADRRQLEVAPAAPVSEPHGALPTHSRLNPHRPPALPECTALARRAARITHRPKMDRDWCLADSRSRQRHSTDAADQLIPDLAPFGTSAPAPATPQRCVSRTQAPRPSRGTFPQVLEGLSVAHRTRSGTGFAGKGNGQSCPRERHERRERHANLEGCWRPRHQDPNAVSSTPPLVASQLRFAPPVDEVRHLDRRDPGGRFRGGHPGAGVLPRP